MLNDSVRSTATTRRSTTIVALVAFSLVIAISRLVFLHDYPEWDASTYAIIGREITLGAKLYVDIWDMKPPAIFATYAAAIWTLPSIAWAKYVLGVVPAIVALLAIHSATRSVHPQAALWSAAMWMVLCSQPILGEDIANVEVFMNACFALAFALTLRLRVQPARKSAPRAALVGAIWAIASLYKQISIFPAIAVCMAEIYIALPGLARRRAIFQSLIMGSMVALGWLVLFIYFDLTSRYSIFFFTFWFYPRYYASSMTSNLMSALQPSHWLPARGAVELVPLVALVIPLMALLRSRAHDRWPLIALAIGCFVAIASPGQFHEHYYQLWLVPLCIGGGIAMARCGKFIDPASPLITRFGRALPVLVLGGLAMLEAHWFIDSPRHRAIERYPAGIFLTVNESAAKIGQLLRPGETMYAWCDEPTIYLLAGHRPAAPALWKMHTIDGPMAPILTKQTVKKLETNPPDLIVLWAWYPGPTDHPIYKFVRQHYVALPASLQAYPLLLCARKDSDLAHRTKAATALY